MLVNNAGGYWNTRHVTADGLERTFALNHLAPFLLTSLLLDRLKQQCPGPRGHGLVQRAGLGRIDFDDLQGERSYSGARAYNQSKLANVLFTYELARRLPGHRASPPTRCIPAWCAPHSEPRTPARVQRLFVPFIRPFMKAPGPGRRHVDPRWPPLPISSR